MPEYRVNFVSGISVLAFAESPEDAVSQACVVVCDGLRREVVESVDELVPFGSELRVLTIHSPAHRRAG